MIHDQITGLWTTMAQGWAAGDAQAFAQVFDADVEFVTVRGEEHHGRDAVEAAHARLFADVYHGTLLKPEVRLVRELSDGQCLVHVLSTVLPAGIVTHAQAVVRRDGEDCSIVAFHNMILGGTTG
jgi:uncharacterized protein (TIGR02246 family)